jgi:hypothetical protein
MSADALLRFLDIAAIAATLVSAWFWFAASGRTLRRVSKTEELDSRDLNRVVTALNRSQILNTRAAVATGISALIVATRYALALYLG